jgi:hypothetical protein
VLTDFQAAVARLVADDASAAGFALAGGGALIVRGVVDRSTRDLDFFSVFPDAVATTASRVEARLTDAGYQVVRQVDTGQFVRLEVRCLDEVCEVDLGHDARRWPVIDDPRVGPTVALEELAADKTPALLGRAAARDFVDVRRWRKSSVATACASWQPIRTWGFAAHTSPPRWTTSTGWIAIDSSSVTSSS